MLTLTLIDAAPNNRGPMAKVSGKTDCQARVHTWTIECHDRRVNNIDDILFVAEQPKTATLTITADYTDAASPFSEEASTNELIARLRCIAALRMSVMEATIIAGGVARQFICVPMSCEPCVFYTHTFRFYLQDKT